MTDSGSNKNTNNRFVNVAAVCLLAIGLTQMAGDLLGVPALKGIGAATMLAPAPKVFTAHKGLETYSTRFFIEWTDIHGTAYSLEVTPAVYSRVLGPYNRRNIYGAVLAFGPVMVGDPNGKPMFDAVAHHALCGNAPLLRELGIDPGTIAGNVRVRYEPVAGSDMGNLPRVLEVACK
jgi:hypothetical protein